MMLPCCKFKIKCAKENKLFSIKKLWKVYSSTYRSKCRCVKAKHTSLGTSSSMFTNFSVFCDVRHFQSLVLGQNVMFGIVRSSILLLCDQTSLETYSLMFVNFGLLWCSTCLKFNFGPKCMFRKFNVQTFNVRSVWSSVFWCSFQD